MKWLTPLLLVLSLLVPTPVNAHDKTSTQQGPSSATFCMYESSLLREDAVGDGYGRGRTRTYKGGCTTAVNRDVAHLAKALRIWYSGSVDGDQRLCVYTSFYYNTEPAWAMGLTLQFPGRAYCGAGWYEVESIGYLHHERSWRGRSVFSGRHFLNV